MKKVTREEEQAYLNELFSLMKKVPQSQYEYLGDDNHSISKWFAGNLPFSQLKVSDQKCVVRLLFDAKRTGNDKEGEIYTICEFLEATQDPKYIELSEKIPLVRVAGPRDFKDSPEAARMLLTRYSKGNGINYDEVRLDHQVKMSNGVGLPTKTVTIGKELQEIRRNGKKLTAKEQRSIKKYNNVDSISFSGLYSEITNFLYYHGGSRYESDYDAFSERLAKGGLSPLIRDIVYEYQSGAIELLNSRKDLQFVKKQPQGKIM